MNNNAQFHLTVLTASMAAMFAPALHAAGAGQVAFATAGVNAVGPNGQSRPLTKGSEVQPGEVIDTGAGRAQLRFTDGGYVSLSPQTQFKLESYGYDKDDPKQNTIVMNLLKGGLRTITGLIGKTNRDGYKLQTTTATVGIRGTEFSITGFPDGSIVFHAADGSIDVTNQSGSTTVSGGQSVNVSSPNTPPVKTDEKPFLPPLLSAAQTQIPAPQNPVQDATAIVAPMLTGTIPGAWRTISEATWIGHAGYGDPNSSVQYLPTFTVSPSGHLTSVGGSTSYGGTINSTFSHSLGGASAQSYGNDGVMAWGRWIGGPTSYVGGYGEGQTFTAADPLHYVVGLPATNVPTAGIGTYSMYGGTPPSCSGPACGNISVGGSLTINFGTYEGSFTMNVANSGDGVKFSTTSGLNFDNNQNVNFWGETANGTVTSTGTTAINTSHTYVAGFLAGPGASHAGAVYKINYEAVSAAYGTTIMGAAVYKR